MKNMKLSSFGAHAFITIAFFFMLLTASNSLGHHHSSFGGKGIYNGEKGPMYLEEGGKEGLGTQQYPTGSSLPDCTHACGSCVPCKRVIVSSKCSAESCPVVYRCMCKGKYYHVPSN